MQMNVLDTRTVPPQQRLGYWASGMTKLFFPVKIEPTDSSHFHVRMAGNAVGPVRAGTIQGLPHRAVRPSQLVRHGDPDSFLLFLASVGSVRIEQGDNACELAAGNVAFHDTSRPSVFASDSPFEVFFFSIPRWYLGPVASHLLPKSATVLEGGDSGLTRLAAPFLVNLAQTAASGSVPGSIGTGAASMILSML